MDMLRRASAMSGVVILTGGGEHRAGAKSNRAHSWQEQPGSESQHGRAQLTCS